MALSGNPTMGIEIRELRPGDEEMLNNVAPDVFDHTPVALLTAEFLNDPRHHLVVALDSGQIVGFVSALHYVHPDKPAELWLNEVAVAPTHRKQGIGRRMLQNMLALGHRLQCRSAWVLTDRANVSAMRLYTSAGGVAESNPSVLFEFELRDPPLSTPSPE